MAQFTRTWWGDRFIKALESITDEGRLSRGRSYARGGKVKSFEIQQNRIYAQVRGSVNPYFGVYKEPTYEIEIEIKPIAQKNWVKAIEKFSAKASIVSKLLLNEVPENIEAAFSELGLNLLPHSAKDFTSNCSCPDYSNPCKHIAGVYYLVASRLDQDPFLLFELRGLSKTELQAQLARSPLGKALSGEMNTEDMPLEPVASLFTLPKRQPLTTQPSARDFWLGAKRLPPAIEAPSPNSVSAILVKKQGDFPAFWPKDQSFIATMEEFYQRIKTKNQELI